MAKPLNPKCVFVVIALHATCHGDDESLLLTTKDLELAVTTARGAESLHYTFNDETGVYVYFVELDKVYDRAAHCSQHVKPLIFSRSKIDGQWKEEWSHLKMEEQFRMVEVADR